MRYKLGLGGERMEGLGYLHGCLPLPGRGRVGAFSHCAAFSSSFRVLTHRRRPSTIPPPPPHTHTVTAFGPRWTMSSSILTWTRWWPVRDPGWALAPWPLPLAPGPPHHPPPPSSPHPQQLGRQPPPQPKWLAPLWRRLSVQVESGEAQVHRSSPPVTCQRLVRLGLCLCNHACIPEVAVATSMKLPVQWK